MNDGDKINSTDANTANSDKLTFIDDDFDMPKTPDATMSVLDQPAVETTLVPTPEKSSSEPSKPRKRKLIDTTQFQKNRFDSNLAKTFGIADLINEKKSPDKDVKDPDVKIEKSEPLLQSPKKLALGDTYKELTALFASSNANSNHSTNDSTQNPLLISLNPPKLTSTGLDCKVCKIPNFPDQKSLKRHYQTPEHLKNIKGKLHNTCKKCKIVFQDKSLLKIHNDFLHPQHSTPGPGNLTPSKPKKEKDFTPCFFCQISYKSLKCLQSHMEKCKRKPKDVEAPTLADLLAADKKRKKALKNGLKISPNQPQLAPINFHNYKQLAMNKKLNMTQVNNLLDPNYSRNAILSGSKNGSIQYNKNIT